MSPGPMWRRYLRFFGPDPRADLDDELRFHLEQRRQRLERQGLTPAEAEAEATRRFGDMNSVREECEQIDGGMARNRRRRERLGLLRQDARYAWRQLRRSPVVTLAVMLVLGLGIGAGATIYALIDAILLRPLPGVRRPSELAALSAGSVSYPMWRDFRTDLAGRMEIAGFSARSFALGATDRTEMVQGLAVTGNYFALLGTVPAAGRLLGEADDADGAAPVAVLGHRYWNSRMGADSSVVGRTIQVNGFGVTVVGVAPPRFRGTQLAARPDIWMTAHGWLSVAGPSHAGRSLEGRGWTWLQVVGRLAPDAELSAAEAVMTRSADRQRETWPNDVPPLEVRLSPAALMSAGGEQGRGLVVGFLGVLAGTVGLVLLLACANVANLMLARASERRREIAVRTALGAGRRRITLQLLTESLVLGIGGGLLGILLAPAFLAVLKRWTFPGGISLGVLGLSLDWRLVLVSLGLAVVTGVLFGLAPAMHAGRQDPAAALYGARTGTGRDRRRMQALLLAGQVAISLTLLIGAGLFTRSLRRGLSADLGFNGDRLAGAQVNLALSRYEASQAVSYYDQVLDRIAALPGVVHAGWVLAPPLTSDSDAESFQIVGDPSPPKGQRRPLIELNVVTPDYWRLLELPIVRGRAFDQRDDASARPVMIVNQTFVRRHVGQRDPIGLRVNAVDDTVEIVGVAADMTYHSVREEPRPYAYFPAAQVMRMVALSPMSLLVRTAGPPASMLPSIGAALAAVDPRVPITGPVTFDTLLDDVLLPERLGVLLVGLMSTLAAIVAAVGISAAVAYAVSRHRRDMAIAVALGAAPPRALRAVLSPTLAQLGAGLVLGLGGGIVLGRTLAGLIYGLDQVEPMTLGLVTLGLAALAAGAALIPARRALRLDPMAELRSD